MTHIRAIALLDRAASILACHGYEDTAADLRELQAELERDDEGDDEGDGEMLRAAHLAGDGGRA